MAIKGKGKTRGGRPGTNAPRPVIVVPKKPFLARPSTRWGAVAVVLIVVGVIMFVAWQEQQEDDERQRQGVAIEEVDRRVTLALQSVATPGTGTTISVLPEFTAQLEQFRAGEARPNVVRRDNRGVPEDLGGAIEVVGGMELPDDLRPEYTEPWLDARQFMVQGLRAYQVAVRLVLDATALEGREQTALLNRASEQVALAAEIFDYGRQKIVNIRVELGTLDATDFNPDIPTG